MLLQDADVLVTSSICIDHVRAKSMISHTITAHFSGLYMHFNKKWWFKLVTKSSVVGTNDYYGSKPSEY